MTSAQHDWAQFALLLTDVQRDFWPDRMAEGSPDFPANVARLLTFCRSEDLEIIHLRASFAPDMSDWMPVYRLRGRIPCIEGTAGIETLPFALEKPGEKVVIKHTFDGFHNPELLRYLQQNGKRFVLTAGLVTSVCVFLTTASATQKGFLAAVVEDCCADRPQIHEQTLETYQFMFQRTTLDLIPDHHPEWVAALRELGE
jgi:nicotinamidase-related amidase